MPCFELVNQVLLQEPIMIRVEYYFKKPFQNCGGRMTQGCRAIALPKSTLQFVGLKIAHIFFIAKIIGTLTVPFLCIHTVKNVTSPSLTPPHASTQEDPCYRCSLLSPSELPPSICQDRQAASKQGCWAALGWFGCGPNR